MHSVCMLLPVTARGRCIISNSVFVCVELMLRPLPPAEPRVAVFVQDRDVTDSSAVLFSCYLFTRSSDI